MEKRAAVLAIIVKDGDSVAALNELLHQYGSYIICRMGVPYRERNMSIISVALDAPANIISALLFAAGHLPTTYILMGISPMILLRCFLLNGTFGLFFGWLYRKYGLRYAMVAHAGCHVVSKLIWILFI